MLPKPHLTLLIALFAAGGVAFFSDHIDPYHLDVLTRIGINIILAVSLNLINGHTGQFSLGHAGFMAVGAYTTAAMTMFAGPHVLPATAPEFFTALWFLAALLAGGIVAAATGL